MTPVHVTALSLHIAAGALGIVTGFVALFAAKGAPLHKRVGMFFVYAMLTMSLMGATMALVWNVAPVANTPVGLLTAYLVITAFTSVRPASINSRRQHVVFMLVPLGVGIALASFGIAAVRTATGKLFGMPSQPFFVFAVIALMCVIGDVQMLRAGGVAALRGAPRLSRHLWRMSTALLIAAFSFFIGQAKIIPRPYRIFPLLMVPPLLVLVMLLYWLWRVRVRKSLRGVVARSASESLATEPVATEPIATESLKTLVPRPS